MYVDPSLIDFNMHVVTQDGIDYWANYGTYSKKYKYNITLHASDTLTIVNDGRVHSKSLANIHPRNGANDGGFNISTTMAPALESPLTEYTLSCWLKLSKIYTKINFAIANMGGHVYDRGDHNYFRVWHSTGGSSSYTIYKSISANTWFYYTEEWTNNTIYCWINGEKAASGTFYTSPHINPCNGGWLVFNSDSGDNSLTTYIDDFVVVRKLLWDPASNFTPPTGPLIDLSEQDQNLSIKKNPRMSMFPTYEDLPVNTDNILKVY